MKHAHSRAREAALKVLYQVDVLAQTPDDAQIRQLVDVEHLKPAAARYALALLEGCLAHRTRIEQILAEALQRWELARLAAIDRCILRLGLYELMCRGDVPPKTVINEAIELAKKYSTEKSGAFVNGILDSVRKTLQGDA